MGMNRQEFVDRLRMALSGRVSASLVEENVSYYNDYINTQIRLGQSEESVLTSLGDPRLIAKSIISANDVGFESTEEPNYKEENRNSYYTQKKENGALKVVNMPRWLVILVGILILIAVISIIGSIVSFLIPIVAPVLLVLFLVKLFRDWLN